MDSNIVPSTRRMTTIPFLLIWLTGHLLAWGGFFVVVGAYNLPDLTYILLFGVTIGGILGLIQKFLLRRAFGLSLHGWLRLTIIGWIVGWLTYFMGPELINGFYNYPLWLTILPMFGIPALLQWVLLRRHVRSGWLWIAAGLVSAITFGTVLDNNYASLTANLLSASAQGAVTGLSLLWLFGMTGYVPRQRQRDFSRLTTDTYDSDDEYDEWYDEDDYHSGRFIQG